MTGIDTLTNDFGSPNFQLDSALMTDSKTPAKAGVKASSPVTPESPSSSVVSSSNSSVCSDDNDEHTTSIQRTAAVSDHKKAELAGQHAEEPLLKENPGRFVLFPIQDAEVGAPPHTHVIYFLRVI